MTVAHLREILSNLPDEMAVLCQLEGGPIYEFSSHSFETGDGEWEISVDKVTPEDHLLLVVE